MQDMNASATADHKALRALAVAKVPSNREQERRRPMAPSIGGTSKFEIRRTTPPHACYRAVAEASIGSVGLLEEGQELATVLDRSGVTSLDAGAFRCVVVTTLAPSSRAISSVVYSPEAHRHRACRRAAIGAADQRLHQPEAEGATMPVETNHGSKLGAIRDHARDPKDIAGMCPPPT